MTLEAALDALAKELRIMNLIACSEPPLIRDARDKIREHFGEKALVPDFEPLPEGHPGHIYSKVYDVLQEALVETKFYDTNNNEVRGLESVLSTEGITLGGLADRITRGIVWEVLGKRRPS